MIRATILGCGSSGGVPRLGGHWGECNPENPRNRRRRCSLLVERHGPRGVTRVLVDTGPDLVPQLTDAGVGLLDGVVWTHPHADHIHGIDDLRQIVHNRRAMLPGWAVGLAGLAVARAARGRGPGQAGRGRERHRGRRGRCRVRGALSVESRSLPVPDGLDGTRVDAALAKMLGFSRTFAAEVAEAGGVRMDGRALGKSDRLHAGGWLEVEWEDRREPEIIAIAVPELGIVYDDEDIVVVDKPVGVAAHASVGWTGPTVIGGLAAAGSVARGKSAATTEVSFGSGWLVG